MPDHKKPARPRQRASPKRSAPRTDPETRQQRVRRDRPPRAPVTADTPLDERERLFVAAYAASWNGAAAAREAGYSERGASVQAVRLLARPNVKAALDRARAERLERLGVRADAVLAELARVAFGNMGDFLTVDEEGNTAIRPGSTISADAWAAVKSVTAIDNESESVSASGSETRKRQRTVSVTLHDKRAALVDLGKHLGIFKEAEDTTRPVLIDFGGLRPMTPEDIEAKRRAQQDPDDLPDLPPEEQP